MRPARRLVTALAVSTGAWISAAAAHPPPALAGASNSPPGAPVLEWPASGTTIGSAVPQVFTIRASDPDGDPYRGTVTIRDGTGEVFARFPTALALSGNNSSGSRVLPLPRGSYTWTASATDVSGNTGPDASSQLFSVGGAPNLGGGTISGTLSFSEPIPPPGQACAATSFDLGGTSAATVISFAQAQFTGPVTFTGSGGSSCENAATGAGSLQLSAQGLGVTATTLDCPNLSGSYTRAVSDVSAVIAGVCTINHTVTDAVVLALSAELLPTSGGITEPTSAAALNGAFVVSPAS